MANPGDDGMARVADDAILTAYLDGELRGEERARVEARLGAEPDLKARLDFLRHGQREFGPAYDALLEAAPVDRLQAMLADLAAKHARAGGSACHAAHAPADRDRRGDLGAGGGRDGRILAAPPARAGARAAGLAAGCGGIPVAHDGRNARRSGKRSLGDRPAALDARAASQPVACTPAKLALPSAELKRAQLYDFRGKPLAEVAYLSPQNGPVAFCIIRNGRPDQDRSFEQREGYNIVFWQAGGVGYMVVGKAPRASLEAYAGTLETNLS